MRGQNILFSELRSTGNPEIFYGFSWKIGIVNGEGFFLPEVSEREEGS